MHVEIAWHLLLGTRYSVLGTELGTNKLQVTPAPTPTSVLSFLNNGDPLTQIILNIVWALLILLVALVLASLIKAWLLRLFTRRKLNLSVAALMGNLAQVGIVFIGTVTALSVIGVPWASLVAVLGVAGLAISLSLQDLLKNVVAGVYILMEQPFRIGDRISVKDVTGIVQGIELRTTILRTDELLQVVVPNNTVLNEIVTNRSASALMRVTLQMQIKGTAKPDMVEQIKEALSGITDVADTPSPLVDLEGISEGMSVLRINFWVPTGKKMEVTSVVLETLQERFQQADLKVAV
jgi:small conductance mechanosensitive channel